MGKFASRFLYCFKDVIIFYWKMWFQIKTNMKSNRWSDVTCGQVWCPILGICAWHLTHPSAHTHTRGSGGPMYGRIYLKHVMVNNWFHSPEDTFPLVEIADTDVAVIVVTMIDMKIMT